MVPIRRAAIAALAVMSLIGLSNASAATIWFDETNAGQGYASFTELVSDYQDFVGQASGVITFDDLPTGTQLANQYTVLGVAFQNTFSPGAPGHDTISGVAAEGGSGVNSLTGYDGSYRPDGNYVYHKIDNDSKGKPFTFTFSQPVSAVSAFVAMGVDGTVHSVEVSLYDATDTLVGQKTVEASLWEGTSTLQNYESFFAASVDTPTISKVQVRNVAKNNSASSLMIDDLAWISPGAPGPSNVPEPTGLLFLSVACCGLMIPRKARPAAAR
jgi:hypothetical protein